MFVYNFTFQVHKSNVYAQKKSVNFNFVKIKFQLDQSTFCQNSQQRSSQHESLSEQVSDRHLPVLTVNPAVLTPFWHKNRPFWQIACQNGQILCQNAVLTLLAQTDGIEHHPDNHHYDRLLSSYINFRILFKIRKFYKM